VPISGPFCTRLVMRSELPAPVIRQDRNLVGFEFLTHSEGTEMRKLPQSSQSFYVNAI
jgi:hypothetical protein